MKNLPIGIQTFKDIINSNNLYVDKTEYIYNLITNNEKGSYFLSRPRRFGKSLLISTLEEIFLGNKELFKDLWIYDKYDFKKFHVIRFDFSKMDLSNSETLVSSLALKIIQIAEEYNILLDKNNTYKQNFSILLKELSKIKKVVILIDEYDKPIVDFIEDLKIVEENKKILKNFYETLKACDEYIKFVFLTGVSKFSRISIFSGLNNLIDLTLDENYSTMLGYTQSELEYYFNDRIKILGKKLQLNYEETKDILRNWYNGYSWDGLNFVYNPFSLMNVLKDKKINNYWFKSGTPTFLIKLIKEKNINVEGLQNFIASEALLDSFEIENIKFESLLFQTGYLTIKNIDTKKLGFPKYYLSYPNIEVKESLLTNILNEFSYNNNDSRILVGDLIDHIENNDLDKFFDVLKYRVFSTIPNEIFMADKERYYHTVIYLILTLIGIRINVEVQTNLGRIDAVIETNYNIYILEFKMSSINQAIKQIDEKRYYEKYLLDNKPVYLIGISFDSNIRNIKDWKIKLLDIHQN